MTGTKTSWNGKGSYRRPMDGDKFNDNYDAIKKKADFNTGSFVMRVNGKVVKPTKKD